MKGKIIYTKVWCYKEMKKYKKWDILPPRHKTSSQITGWQISRLGITETFYKIIHRARPYPWSDLHQNTRDQCKWFMPRGPINELYMQLERRCPPKAFLGATIFEHQYVAPLRYKYNCGLAFSLCLVGGASLTSLGYTLNRRMIRLTKLDQFISAGQQQWGK